MSHTLSPLFSWRGAICDSGLSPTIRHVALTLSLHMNERGGSCFPAVSTLVHETGLSERAVRDALKALGAGGWLTKETRLRQDGGQSSNIYTAAIPNADPGASPAPPPVHDGYPPRGTPGAPQEDVSSLGRQLEDVPPNPQGGNDGVDAFLAHVDREVSAPCWMWTGSVTEKGYGLFFFGGSTHRAHRWIMQQFADIEGLEIHHACGVTGCVNPEHLDAVTRPEHDAVRAERSHCRQGHALEGENLYVSPSGVRRCRTCYRSWWSTRYGPETRSTRKRGKVFVPVDEERFERFWSVWRQFCNSRGASPGSKKTAGIRWGCTAHDSGRGSRTSLSDADRDAVMADLDAWSAYYVNPRSAIPPHATTWLNERRWETPPPTVGAPAVNGTAVADRALVADLAQFVRRYDDKAMTLFVEKHGPFPDRLWGLYDATYPDPIYRVAPDVTVPS